MTETQIQLRNIWKQVLQHDRFGLEDNFFEIGGDLYLVQEMIETVRRQFDVPASRLEMSAVPTIMYLADIIDSGSSDIDAFHFRALRLIQKGEPGKVPLFLVHGGGGVARMFKLLSNHLPSSIPVYAFRWAGWDGKGGSQCMKNMGDVYYKEMRQVRPHGPYRLGGYCIGGLIAMDMLNRLKAEGETVDMPLFIWDTPNIRSAGFNFREPWYMKTDRMQFNEVGEELQQLQQECEGDGEPIEIPKQFLGKHEFYRKHRWAFFLVRQAQVMAYMLPVCRAKLQRKPVPIKYRSNHCRASCHIAHQRYRSSTCAHDIVFFRSGMLLGHGMNLPGWWSDPFIGFRELCIGRFEAYVVGHDHYMILGDSFSAKRVSEEYEKADHKAALNHG